MKKLVSSLISHGVTSLFSLVLTVVVAQDGGATAVGQFAVAYSVYIFSQIVVRETVINDLLVMNSGYAHLAAYSGRVSLLVVPIALAALAYGFMSGSLILIVVGFSLHGMVLLYFSKCVNLVLGRPSLAHFQDVLILALVVTAMLLFFYDVFSSLVVVSVWALASAVIGYASCFVQKFRVFPFWGGPLRDSASPLLYGLQGAASSGSVHVMTLLLDAFVGSRELGAVRTNSTLIGPANLLVTAAQPLILTSLGKDVAREEMPSGRKVAKLTVVFFLGYTAVVACLVGLGMRYGDQLFQEAWVVASPLLLLVAADGVLSSLGVVPLSLHRAVGAVARTLRITFILLLIRLPLVIGGGLAFGAMGIAQGFLISSLVASFFWWTSYFQLSRNGKGRAY